MSSLKLLGASVLSAALLSACASGKGGFDLDNVNHDQAGGKGQPAYQDDTSHPRRDTVEEIEALNQPSLGYAVEVPRRNLLAQPAEPNNINITPDKVQSINYGLNELPDVFANKIKANQMFNANGPIGVDTNGIDYSHDGSEQLDKRDFTYIRSGYVLGANRFWRRPNDKVFYNPGQMGYVFYQGSKPAVNMPTQTVTYKGYWDFVSNASKTRTVMPDGFSNDNFNSTPGVNAGATSLDAEINRKDKGKPLGQTAEFEADFGSKKLTGTLTSNGTTTNIHVPQQIDKRYTIAAEIKGNRFRGSATAQNKTHEIFGKDSKNLEGGFFGPNAEELAGKFLADDHSLFAVFGAKHDKNLSADQLQTLFDAVKIDSSSLAKSSMDTFGNAAYLVLDGKTFSLLPSGKTKFADMAFNETFERDHNGKKYSVTVCCNNLDYVKFGQYGEKQGTGVVNGHFFLQGERASESVVSNIKGKVHYRGTWEAHITSKDSTRWSTSASDTTHGSRSQFDFDFDSKTFTGKLIANNGLEDKPTLSLSGKIKKNGFTGTAQTAPGGFNIDPAGRGVLVNINAKVEGAFFGPNATEIGGTVHSAENGKDKIGGVFGGKRQKILK